MAKSKRTNKPSSAKRTGDGPTPIPQLTEADVRASIPAARARAERARLTEPRAVSARFEARSGRIVVELSNGMTLAAHPHLLADALAGATPAQLARIEVFPSGTALRWDALDLDLDVTALFEHLLGDHARIIAARQAGRTKTARKARSARKNGKLGGRPRGRSSTTRSS